MGGEQEGRHAVRAEPTEPLGRAGVHGDAGGVEIAERRRARPAPRRPRRPPTAPQTTSMSLNGRRSCTAEAICAGVAADEARARGVRPRLPGGGGEGVRADVGDLARARRAGQLDELVPDRDHRHPRPRVDEHLVAPGRGEQPDLGGAEHGVAADGDVARLDVLAEAADERRRRHAAGDRDARATRVGVADGHDGVGERRQRRTRGDAHRLAGLQPQRMPRACGDLADHRQLDRHHLARAEDVDAAHGVAVDGGHVEAGHRARADDLLGAPQAVRLRDRQPHRRRAHRGAQHPFELLVDRPHGVSAPAARRARRAAPARTRGFRGRSRRRRGRSCRGCRGRGGRRGAPRRARGGPRRSAAGRRR